MTMKMLMITFRLGTERIGETLTKGNQRGPQKQVSNRYQPFDLVEWGSQRRGSHLANGWSSLKLSSAYNAVHCVIDPGVMRALLK